jgi:hypothetical protein
MADAAFAVNIPPGFDVAAGYYGGPGAYHVWPAADWRRFPGFRLPIWVAGEGPKNGTKDAANAANVLVQVFGVPRGSFTVLDMEMMRDVTYVEAFGAGLQASGYRVWVYGSAGTVFGNPPLNGYWVADYTSDMGLIDQLMQTPHVRAVQYTANLVPGYDVSLVKQWTEGGMWSGS